MNPFTGRRIFSVGDSLYTWEDLILAAHLWGDWEPFQRKVSAGLACLKRLEETEGEEETLSEEELSSAAAEFRYARDLVTAEEMEAWLTRRGLTADDWLDYIRRTILITKWADELADIQEEYPVSQDDVDQILVCDAFCGGLAAELASRLAARAALHARVLHKAPDDGDGIAATEVQSVLETVPAEIRDCGIPELPAAACRDRLAALARLELAWRRFTAIEVTPQAIREQIALHQFDWMRLSIRSLSLPTLDAAHEAALCVREDGCDLAQVEAGAGARVEEADWFLGEVDIGIREHLAGALKGELLGPFQIGEAFVLILVCAKQFPTEEEPAVRARAERALVADIVDREVGARVTWHERL